MRAKMCGNAPWTAIDSEVRDAGRIVVCVDAIPDVMIASATRNENGPSTSSATLPRMFELSSKFWSLFTPAIPSITIATPT